MATVVTDDRALIDADMGAYIAGTDGSGALIEGKPQFVTFSFEVDGSSAQGDGYTQSFRDSFQPLTSAERDEARTAFAQWDQASGVHFLEVPAGQGDIKLGKFNFDLGGPMSSSQAASYGGYGIVYVSDKVNDAGVHTFLHEIGHNLGLKHPFEGDFVLSAADDNWGHTVMSYTPGGYPGTVLGSLDLAAIADLYGPASSDGSQDASWSWNASTATLTQTGFSTADTLVGVGGFNLIHAGDGDDSISGRPSAKGDFYGDAGNDTLSGQQANLHLYGGVGDDVLSLSLFNADPSAAAAAASLFGGDGADALNVFVSSAAAANLGGLTLDAGAGDDAMSVTLSTAAMAGAAQTPMLIDGGAGSDTLTLATIGDDAGQFGFLSLAQASLRVQGVETLQMYGSDGVDVLIAGDQAAQLSGGAGDDALIGGAGDDTLIGGDPAGTDQDWMHGGLGDDSLVGGAQSTADLAEARAVTTVSFSDGVIVASGPDGVDTLSGVGFVHFTDGLYAVSNGALVAVAGQLIVGTTADDVLAGTSGDDTMVGGGGDDVAVLREPYQAVTLSYGAGGVIVVSGPDGSDQLSGFDQLRFLNGSFDVDAQRHLIGFPGLVQSAGDQGQVLVGGVADDTLSGGAGADTLTGGIGSDRLFGGGGVDTATYAGFSRDYQVTMSAGSGVIAGGPEGGTDTLSSVENVRFLDGVLTFDSGSAAAQVVRLYDSFLGRAPDVAGFNNYMNYVASGHSFQDMAANAASSAEFHNATANLSDVDYVTYVYEHSLHRAPDAGGLASYVAALENGTFTRTSMIVQAAESPEHVALTHGVMDAGLWIPDEKVEGLELLYDAAVQRQPDASGIAGYSQLLASGATFRSIANQMATSAEFQAAHGSQTDAEYIDSLYVAEVGRHPDDVGLSAYLQELSHGYTRGDVLWQTAMSQEHQSHVLAHYDPLLEGLG